jgi:hypothetical protein
MSDEAMDNIELIFKRTRRGIIMLKTDSIWGMCRTYPLVVPADDLRTHLIPS